MQDISTNIGAFITTRFALVRTAFGAGAGGNLAATDGTAFQRSTKRPLDLSAKLVVGWKATIASGQSMAVTSVVKQSADGITYTALTDGTVATTINGLNSGAAQTGTIEVDVNLIGAHDYIRPTISATLTQSGTSTAEVFAVLVLGGGETAVPAALADI